MVLSDHNFDVHIVDRLFENTVHQIRDYKKCHWQNFKTIIGADGNVYLCTQRRDKVDSIIGNIYEQSLAEIWIGQRRKNTLQTLQIKECPPLQKQFLYIGRIHPIKGIDKLIEAVAISKYFFSEGYALVIAGDSDNPYGNSLKDMVNQLNLSTIITFVGLVEGTVKKKLFAESYAMVLPSHSENFANVVTESLSYSTPVIASYGTPWEILSSEQAGIWCSNDPVLLAESIDSMIKLSKNDYLKMRTNAKRLLDEHYSMETGVKKWIEQYHNALK